MAPKFDKKNTKTFQLFQRSENDPKNHTEDGPMGIFYETKDLNSREAKDRKKPKVIGREQLDAMHDEFMAEGRRENEGEAALYGITFDDSNYDYMQHLRPIGQYKDAYFIGRDGKVTDSYIPPEAQGRVTLQDLLNGGSTEEDRPQMSFREHYQSQLPVQDAIAGLKPDMDPRLREVLEALEDEEYIENEEEDVFSELLGTGEIKDEAEWRKTAEKEKVEDLVQGEEEADWEFAFRKFKLEDKQTSDYGDDDDSNFGSLDQEDLSEANFGSESDDEDALAKAEAAEARDSLGALAAPRRGAAAQQSMKQKQKKQKKKRIGAKTDLSGYSMSSSANYRNEGLTLLDDKFELVEEDYVREDEPEEESQFDMSKERPDLDSIMDDFLDKYVVEGKHLVKKVNK